MKCFSVEEESVTKGLPVIPAPFPHVAIGKGGQDRNYTRINVSAKFAMSLILKPRRDERWCRNSRLEQGCSRMKAKGACSLDCPDRQIEKKSSDAEYASVIECCILKTINGGYLIVEPRRGDPRGLVHVKLPEGNLWHLSFFRESDTTCPSINGRDASLCNALLYDLSSGNANLIPVEGGAGTRILADGSLCNKSDREKSGTEFLLIMEPGSAFVAVREESSEPMQFAAYYDGQDVRTRSSG